VELILVAATDGLAAAWRSTAHEFDWVSVHEGDILDVDCDAVVSPANSFGFMDGGIDAHYIDHFGPAVQLDLRRAILERHRGELLVGRAELVATGHDRIPWLIAAPTMRVPMALPTDTINPYLAARAVLNLVHHGEHVDGSKVGQPIRDDIAVVAMPGLGTGVGRVSDARCARQVRAAILAAMSSPTLPQSWADASWEHQLLYTDNPKRLQ
jgi:O-acetyl-ADP-ribose deacetylase (regulator of RNase III)